MEWSLFDDWDRVLVCIVVCDYEDAEEGMEDLREVGIYLGTITRRVYVCLIDSVIVLTLQSHEDQDGIRVTFFMIQNQHDVMENG